MEKPTILLIPGLWEGPSVFTSISTTLQALGYPTLVAKLPSTGTTSSDPDRHTITMRDDEQAIRYMVKPLVIDKGKTVIMVIIPSHPPAPRLLPPLPDIELSLERGRNDLHLPKHRYQFSRCLPHFILSN